MPRRTDLHTIIIIGAGPIIIGQACEFDYSGTQACKALKADGYRVVLVNSNPATIMTDPEIADATYIEPVTPDAVRLILQQERAHHGDVGMALLPTMGGQVALNLALALEKDGTLERLNIELIGARADVIERAEDRQLFRDAMDSIDVSSPKSQLAHSVDEALEALEVIGLPAILRPSFTLGGTGGGIAYNRDDFVRILDQGLRASPIHSVLIEESMLGWKEYEMEVIRDRNDNCIIVCSIENIDPMGVHTGDSITVAPAITLTDKEYQVMRNTSMQILRTIGVETGGSNVQFAVDPRTGRQVVIEMNPRVSRSSALASKATGFPIAAVAARLAVGYTLDEIPNEITASTPASFEPSLDYIVVKIPRFAFEKFPLASPDLNTSMKSVGEAMALGRNFREALQKALRSLEIGLNGLDPVPIDGAPSHDAPSHDALCAAVARAEPQRLLTIAQAMRHGLDIGDIHRLTSIDMWFLRHIQGIVHEEQHLASTGLPSTPEEMMRIKAMGFADARLATLTGQSTQAVTRHRESLGVAAHYLRVDTCAGEFPTSTAYMYGVYAGDGRNPSPCESRPSSQDKVVILGGGPNRISQGIEFDYCCVHAAYTLRELGLETIMVNCNPETVSTDYDTADRLYFEPLCTEDVLNIIQRESSCGTLRGVIVQFGGQTPLKLAQDLEAANIPILGTAPDSIDLAEDRERFQRLIQKLDLLQPPNDLARNRKEALEMAEAIGFPLVIRPSYVLGGRAMEIVHDREHLQSYIDTAVQVSGDSPVLLDRYLDGAIEIDVDVLADGHDVFVAGIMEHIEQAGVHSGDSACVLPPHSLPEPALEAIRHQSTLLAKALKVCGLMNVQFAYKDARLYVIEVNPRASRTTPFVAKATRCPLIKWATRIMAGQALADILPAPPSPSMFAVKEAVFPFDRFPGVDVMLGPEMRSTGEVMGQDHTFPMAFAKAQLAAGQALPAQGTAFISVRDEDKSAILPAAQSLHELGFTIVATSGTAAALCAQGLEVQSVRKVMEGSPHIVDAMINNEIQLVFNTTQGHNAIRDSFSIRRTALQLKIPYYTTVAGALAATQAIQALKTQPMRVTTLQA